MALSGSIVNEVRYGVFDFNIAGVKFIGKKQRKVLEKPPGTVIGQVLDEGGREFQLSGRLFNDLLADPFPLRFAAHTTILFTKGFSQFTRNTPAGTTVVARNGNHGPRCMKVGACAFAFAAALAHVL